MPEIPSRLVKIGRSFEQTYRPVLAFDGWKVAMLRHFEVVDPAGFWRVERHRNTNEVFILTSGQADLIVFDGEDRPLGWFVHSMESNVAYNVAQSVWHHIVMSPDAHIILFEREETSVETTDYWELDAETLRAVRAQFAAA